MHQTFSAPGQYTGKVDRVMTQVDRITEDIDHMPVASFIFRDQESDEVQFSENIRWTFKIYLDSRKDVKESIKS